jgi:two-component system, NtrC family, sensor kinase
VLREMRGVELLTSTMPSLARRFGLYALLVLTAALAVLGVHGFRQKVESFQPLGFEPAGAGPGWTVRAIASPPPAKLEIGDRIVLVNGLEAGRIGELRRELRATEESRLEVLRGERLVSVTYRRPTLDIDWPWLALALLGVGYLAIGLFTLWRAAGGTLFFAWCLASATLYFFTPVFPVDGVGVAIYLVDHLARLLLPPLTLHLFLDIARPTDSVVLRRGLIYLPAVALAAIQLDLAVAGGGWLVGRPTASLLTLLDRVEIAHLVAFAATAIAVLARRLRTAIDWEHHRRLLWLVVGTAGGYLPFLLLYGIPFLAGRRPGELLTVVAVAPLAAVPLAFGWAVLRYRLWDLGLIVRNGVAYGLTLLVGVGAFTLLDLALRRALPGDLSFARDLLTFLGGVAIVGLIAPTHRRLQSALERLQHGALFGHRRGLAWLGQELLRERDLDRLCELLLSEVGRALDLDRENLLLAQGERLVAVRPELDIPASFPLSELDESAWSGRFDMLSGVALPGETHRLPLRLYAAGYRYLFPLVVRDARVGLLVTGMRRDDEPFDSEDIELVRMVLDQAALAIENARLIDQVQSQLEQVVALQQHNEGILESSPAGIAVLDADDLVVSSNLAFAALAGRARPEILGRPLVATLELGRLPAPGEPPVTVDCKDGLGRLRFVEASVGWLRGQGADRRVLAVQDVTDRVAMERALREKDRLASLGVLAAGVAHEVNTPLTGISSYAQMLLAETAPDDPRRELLEKVEKQTFRASRIVSNLLEFARKPGRERREIDLGPLLAETAELLRERMSARRARLVWQPPSESIPVIGSEGELQQVFTNLMLNAIDAMAELGGGELRLALERRDGRAVVSVEDDGCGVPAELRDAIFQPFVTTKRGTGGTGLGLSICFAIVEQHGGVIAYENLAPRGCRFRVELPLAGERAEADA